MTSRIFFLLLIAMPLLTLLGCSNEVTRKREDRGAPMRVSMSAAPAMQQGLLSPSFSPAFH